MRGIRQCLFHIWVIGVSAAAVQCAAQTAPLNPVPPPQASAETAQRLTLAEARSIALQNHPQIQAATQLASAAAAQVKEVQSLYYPQANGAATGTYAENNSRIAAGY